MKTKTRPICKKEYQLGFNGVSEGRNECLEIWRDENEYAWMPDEQEKTFLPVSAGDDLSQAYVVKRSDAKFHKTW